jgi:UPF0755 protein
MRRAATIVVFVALFLAGWIGASIYMPYQGFPSQGVYVDIPHGASLRTIARLLADTGVVRSRWVFEGLCRWRTRRTLEAGEYFFDRPVTSREVFETIASGRVYVRELVIPEGFSMFDVADLVAREDFTTRENFLAAARNPALIRDLVPGAPSLEGFLFPAVYEFPRHPTGEQMVSAMVAHFRQEWAAISAEQKNLSGLPLEQVVTLASLVERETPKAEERPLVAGVFLNRLQHHIPLQCDPTVVYSLELAGHYSGSLDATMLPFDSPTTPIAIRACRRAPLPIRGAPRSEPHSILPKPTISTSSPIPKAGISSARRWRSTITTSRCTATGSRNSAVPPLPRVPRQYRGPMPLRHGLRGSDECA